MDQYSELNNIKARITKHFNMPYSFSAIHGSGDCCFENIAFSIGNHEETIDDKDITAFYEFYMDRFIHADDITDGDFVRSIVLNCLLFMGAAIGRRDAAVWEAFLERLNRVRGFAISGEGIYYTNEERAEIKGIPKVWRETDIVRYEHTNQYLRLPIVYDLLGYSTVYGSDRAADALMGDVVGYVLGDEYQKSVKPGYGIGINGGKGFVKSAYYSVGWDIGLSDLTPRKELLYMTLLSRVSGARSTEWYSANRLRYRAAVESGDRAFILDMAASVRKTYWSSGCYLISGRSNKERSENVISVISRL